MKIAAIVGSGRSGSYNQMLARELKELGKNKDLDIDILDIKNLPMYSEDIEKDSIESVENLREEIRSSDGIIFISPEHNLSIPALLKNAIDWMSRVDQVIIGKPAMIAGASMGVMGTVNAQNHLREILNSQGVGAITMPGNQIYIGTVHEKFDEEGRLIDEGTKEFLDSTLSNFVDWLEKIK